MSKQQLLVRLDKTEQMPHYNMLCFVLINRFVFFSSFFKTFYVSGSCFRTLADIFVLGVSVFLILYFILCDLTEIRNEWTTAGEVDRTEPL